MNFKKIKSRAAEWGTLFWSKFKPFLLCMAILLAFGAIFGTDNIYIGISLAFVSDTLVRMSQRAFGCVVGVLCFLVIFRQIIDPKYSTVVLMVCGFLSSVPSQYKIQQIFVTINALGAAMILLDQSQSIALRLLFLLLGIVIVLLCSLFMEKLLIPFCHARKIKREEHVESLL